MLAIMGRQLYFIDTNKFEKALLQLSNSVSELSHITEDLKDSVKGSVDQVNKKDESGQELCPNCETPLIVKREPSEIPGQSREYAFCRGCGYCEA